MQGLGRKRGAERVKRRRARESVGEVVVEMKDFRRIRACEISIIFSQTQMDNNE